MKLQSVQFVEVVSMPGSRTPASSVAREDKVWEMEFDQSTNLVKVTNLMVNEFVLVPIYRVHQMVPLEEPVVQQFKAAKPTK